MVLGIHPFPARMAPEIALRRLRRLRRGSKVLDPMAGSGTVLYQAGTLGHHAIGLDIDPLAVLMARVAISSISAKTLAKSATQIVAKARKLKLKEVKLPWIDSDPETRDFIKYWFAPHQRKQLRKLVYTIRCRSLPWHKSTLRPHLELAISKLIVTKQRGASLAWDVSHSRPHKIDTDNDFDVFLGFIESCSRLTTRLAAREPIHGDVRVRKGDARNLSSLRRNSIDAVLTSPPYLNAIDYLRGHKLALVWMGYSISKIRLKRAKSIGSERRNSKVQDDRIAKVRKKFGEIERLPERLRHVVDRYANDLLDFCGQIYRVMKPGASCWFVIGDSCLRGTFLANSKALKAAAKAVGLEYVSKRSREIPTANRYLPMPDDRHNRLSRRMRQEVILSLKKPFRHPRRDRRALRSHR